MIHLSVSNKQEVVSFRRWQGKGYSLFKALGRIVRIAVLPVIYFISTQAADAQEDIRIDSTQTDYSIEEIEVRGQRVETTISQLSRVIAIVTRKEIEQSPAHTIQDYLRFELSIDLRQRGPEGVQNDISLRGSSFEQVLILLNGIPFNDPQSGHFNADIPIPLIAVERIELIEGPASRFLGPNAYAGAINIVTKRNMKKQMAGEIRTGQYKYLNTELLLQSAGEKNSYLLAGGITRTDGYAHNTDFKGWQGYSSATINLASVEVFTQIGGLMKGFGAQAFYTPVYPEQYEEIASGFASLAWSKKAKVSFRQEIYYKTHFDEFHLFRNEAPSWYKSPNHHISQVFGLTNNAWWDSGMGRTSIGADWRSEYVLSTVLGEPLSRSVQVPGNNDVIYTNKALRQHLSLFAEQNWNKGRVSVSGGILAQLVEGVSRGIHFYPGVDVKYRSGERSNVYMSLNRSLRLPTFTELYYKSVTMQGNNDLLPEEAWTAGVGYKYIAENQFFQVDVFGGYCSNSIDWTREFDEDFWISRNIGQILRSGLEITHTWSPSVHGDWKGLSLSTGYRFAYLDYDSGSFDSRYVLDYLKHKFLLKAHLPFRERLNLDITGIWQDRAGAFTDWTAGGEPFQNEYDSFWLIDAQISYQYHMTRLTISVSNLLNKEYEDIAHIFQPGIWWKIGLSFIFNKIH